MSTENKATENNAVENKAVLSGMRRTGRLHLGHYSVLENWAALQEQYDAYFFIADYHTFTNHKNMKNGKRKN